MNNHSCSSCPNTDKCREVWAEENKGPLTSGGLAVLSAIAFLLPIAIAIIAGAAGQSLGCSEGKVMICSAGGFVGGG